MFINCDFNKIFISEVIKLNEFHKQGLSEKIVASELHSIIDGKFESSYIESKKIHLAENDIYLAELIIIRRSDFENDHYIHSTPFDLCILPVAGDFEVIEYFVDENMDIVDKRVISAEEEIFLIGKTSKTNRFYVAQPKSHSCLIITASSKIDCDEYYCLYDKKDYSKSLVSYNLQESRAQMWLENFSEFQEALPDKVLRKISYECETTKFREYLEEVLNK